MYSHRSNKAESNLVHIKQVMETHLEHFAPLLDRCPNLDIILAQMLILRLGWRVMRVDWTSSMTDWDEEDCRRVGISFAIFLR